MSDVPEIGGTEPIVVDVVAGETYWWCRCGRSQEPAVLRRLARGHGLEPMEWKAERSAR
jgi:hypothetical protein